MRCVLQRSRGIQAGCPCVLQQRRGISTGLASSQSVSRITAQTLSRRGIQAGWPCVQKAALSRAADETAGFSGRELAKLMASLQAAAFGTANATLTHAVFDETLRSKLAQHAMRQRLAAA